MNSNTSLSETQRKRFNAVHTITNLFFNKLRFWGSRKTARLISKILLPAFTQKIICPTIFNFDLIVTPKEDNEIYYLGFYEIGTLNVIKSILSDNDTFIDVGANIGLMSLFASKTLKKKGKIYAFEPVPHIYSSLKEAIELNNLKNIVPLNLALGEKQEQLPIFISRACPSMIKSSEESDHFIVNVDLLDSQIKKHKIKNIKAVKIDVEGFELSVLKGAKELLSGKTAPIVCIEYISSKVDKNFNGEKAIEYLLKLNNYKLYQLLKSSNTISKLVRVDDPGKLRSHDNVFCFLENHLENIPKQLLK